jgi:hypothetical protein
MKRKLDRILRIRELVEDLSRLDLEGKAAELRNLKMRAESQRRLALETRAAAVRILTDTDSTKSQPWQMRIADAKIFDWKDAKLQALARAEQSVIDKAREELLERRRERLQVEILHTNAVHEDEKSRIRREQNRTDDWFQSQRGFRDRNQG